MIALLGLLAMGFSIGVLADPGIPAFTVETAENGDQNYSLTIQILLLMTGLTLLPAALIATTSFLRIVIVLALLRQALGTMQTPSNQVLIGLALFLTLFIMAPVLDKIYDQAVSPYMEEQINFKQAVEIASKPMHQFMLQQTREDDLGMFAEMAEVTLTDPQTVPFKVLIPAFMTSELKTAFQIGFMLFIPFLIIGLLVGMFQAATQINEMTLSFIPKLAIVGIALVIAGPWMLTTLISFTRELYMNIPALIG